MSDYGRRRTEQNQPGAAKIKSYPGSGEAFEQVQGKSQQGHLYAQIAHYISGTNIAAAFESDINTTHIMTDDVGKRD